MSYSLIRDSVVLLEYDNIVYKLDALANFEVSTGYSEYKSNRKTIHRKTNYAVSKVTAQDPTQIALILNLTDTKVESLFMELLGWKKNGSLWELPFTSKVSPIMFNLYISNKYTYDTLKFEYCFCTAVDLVVSKEVPVLNVVISAGKFIKTNTLPIVNVIQGMVKYISYIDVSSEGFTIPAIKKASISIQQQAEFRDQKSIHDIGTIYNNSRAIISEMNISGVLELYYLNNISSLLPEYNIPITIKTKYININFPLTRLAKRLELSDVYSLSYDMIPMEQSDNVTLEFTGEL